MEDEQYEALLDENCELVGELRESEDRIIDLEHQRDCLIEALRLLTLDFEGLKRERVI